jgi:hypothetical protein
MNRPLLLVVATLVFGTGYSNSCRADWDADLADNGVLSIAGDDSYSQSFEVYIDGDELIISVVEAELPVETMDLGQFEFSDEDFDLEDVIGIVFDGLGGEDIFINNTNIPCFLYGGDGDDRLTGGYADDYLEGGPGVDALFGGPNFTQQAGGTHYAY